MYKKFNIQSSEIVKVLAELSRQLVVVPVDVQVITKAIQLKEQYKYGFYDSQIISSSLISRADILLTEDLQNGQSIGSMRIVNPFK